jgi:DNA sulfur modification protein DndC
MPTFFDDERLSLAESLELTAQSLIVHGSPYRHWCLAYSGGKDSTATLAAVVHLIEHDRVPKPETLTVLYADTRMELPPLHHCALSTLEALRSRGEVGERPLMILGLRLGESAARDARIALSCGRDGGECGQGWFQQRPPADAADTLSPILHWRTCLVWDWLMLHGKAHNLDCQIVAEVYDQDVDGSANEVSARTGCTGCPLASQDFSLQRILRRPQWTYLEPLRRLKPLYEMLREHQNRLRKDNNERRVDGSLVANPGRIGPLTMAARKLGLEEVLSVQTAVNMAAESQGRPCVDLLDAEEEARIRELWELNTWPDRWTGDELPGDTLLPDVFGDGTTQELLFGN